nr:MAG TPA: hypothetical protein [Bacteriophage sp.]
MASLKNNSSRTSFFICVRAVCSDNRKRVNE